MHVKETSRGARESTWHAGTDVLLSQQQVVRLVWRVTDEASNSVAALLPQAMSFLFTTLDGCTLEQLAASAPLATCARQCLRGIMHMLAHRYQAMVAVDAGVKAAPCIAAQRFATFLEAVAAGNVASVHPQDLRELLEEFFDMQRVVRSPHHACCCYACTPRRSPSICGVRWSLCMAPRTSC
jgi:hypothetical protein